MTKRIATLTALGNTTVLTRRTLTTVFATVPDHLSPRQYCIALAFQRDLERGHLGRASGALRALFAALAAGR